MRTATEQQELVAISGSGGRASIDIRGCAGRHVESVRDGAAEIGAKRTADVVDSVGYELKARLEMVEENTKEAGDAERPPGARRRSDVRFAVKPRIVVTESGPTISFELAYQGRASVDVGFRLSWKGKLLDYEGPAVNLRAGSDPYKVRLQLPIDSGVGSGAKVEVTVVGPDGEALAVSSTGVVSVSLPGGSSLALGAKGAVASVAIFGGSVVGVAAWVLGGNATGEPPADAAAASTTTTEAEEPAEPGTTPAHTTTVPDVELWPLVVPRELEAAVDEQPSEAYPLLEFFAFGRPEPLTVSFEERPGGSPDTVVVDVAVRYERRSHVIGLIELPSVVDPASDLTVLERSVSAQAVPLIDAGTGSSRVCFNDEVETLDWHGGYRTSSGVGDIDLRVVPLIGDGVVSVAVAVEYVSATELELLPGVDAAIIDSVRCPASVPDDRFVWVGVAQVDAVEAGESGESGEETADEVSAGDETANEATDDAPAAEVDDGDAAEVEFAPEPASGSLSVGDVGDRVTALQRALALRGLFDGAVDGRFGPATETAVRDLQTDEGLEVDGLAGPTTHAVLGLPYPAAGGVSGLVYEPEPTTGSLRLGHEGDRVAALQQAMSQQGYMSGDIDGAFGPVTEAAVRDVQVAFGLQVDGIAGPATHEALGLAYP